MASSRGKRSRTEPQVEQKEIKVGHKYECRFNNDPDEKMVSCITKEKKPDGTWLVQYSGKSTQVIVDECNISATNGNVMVPYSTPERAAKIAATLKNKADAVKVVVFEDTPVVVAIENTNVVGPTQGKSTSEGPNVIAAVESGNPLDVMNEIKRQGKFQLSNNQRFRELAVMKLKEPKEAWSSFELSAWFDEIENEVANLAPEKSLCEWIMKQANVVRTMFLRRMERIKEDEPTPQGTEKEKEQDVVDDSDEKHIFDMKVEVAGDGIQKKEPVALRKLNTSIKREGDRSNPKFDDLPSEKAYVVVPRDALFACPDIEEKETNGFNQRKVRDKVKGTVYKTQALCLSGSGGDPSEAFSKALFYVITFKYTDKHPYCRTALFLNALVYLIAAIGDGPAMIKG